MPSQYPIIGMSPGNSYFKDKEVNYLLTEIIKRFGRTAIFVPDVPAISTYLAYGYPNKKARNKAVLNGNNLKNRTRRITKELGIESNQVRIINWENEVQNDPEYLKIYHNRIELLYEKNDDFRREAHQTTRQVLNSSGRVIEDLDSATRIACHYLLSEIAFLEFAPPFFQEHQITYVYHKPWPIYESYISGAFDGEWRNRMDFLLLESP